MLAVEPRLLLPRDIDTGHLCYVHLTVVYLDTVHYTGQQVRLQAPCILPELSKLQEVWIFLFRRGADQWHISDLRRGEVDGYDLHYTVILYASCKELCKFLPIRY